MAAVFPGAPDVDTFWRNIVDGVDATAPAPPGRIDPVFFSDDPDDRAVDRFYCRRGGFIPDVDFEAASYGVMPATARDAEPDQLLALATASRALADAGLGPSPENPERYGVVIGRGGYITPATARLSHRVHTAQQLVEVVRAVLPEMGEDGLQALKERFQEELGTTAPESAIDIVPNLVASRTANRLDLHGPAYTVDAACASSMVALSHAVEALTSGRADVMLAGGVHHCHDVSLWSVFSQLGALSRAQRIRPYDRGADGIVIGEGTGIVVLKRLADAERDGDRIYAVVSGVGLASDGRSGSLMSPSSAGQVRAVEAAWRAAGLDPHTVGLIEGHGTATAAGDAAELATLRTIINGDPRTDPPVGLGSVKSMIGHAMPASGIAGFIKTALALHHRVLPPTLHCDEPHPDLDGTRLVPVQKATAWEDGAVPRRAGVNAFGFGGISGHVVLEEHGGRRAGRARTSTSGGGSTTGRGETPRVFVAAGGSASDVLALLADDDAVLAGSLPDRVGIGPVRLAIAEPTPRRLRLARQVVEKGTAWRGRNDLWFSPAGLLSSGGRVAFLFPGLEGGAGTEVADVVAHFGLDLEQHPHLSEIGREATGLVHSGRALTAALADLGVAPDAVVGHSLGEWTAMMVAGVIPDAMVDPFVRGLMGKEALFPDVVYLVVGCDVATAHAALGDTGVVVSHDNCPHQSILCGAADAIATVRDRLVDQQVLCQELPFRTGFHTPMFAENLDEFLARVSDLPLESPRVPLWSGVTARPFPHDQGGIRELATRLFVEPVRFREVVDGLYAGGVRAFVQLGVGALTGFVGDTLQGQEHLTVAAADRSRPALAQLTRAAAALWVEGAEVDLGRLLGGPKPSLGLETVARATSSTSGGPTVRLRFDLELLRPSAGFEARFGRTSTSGDDLAHLSTGGDPVLAELAATLQAASEASRAVASAVAAPPRASRPPADSRTEVEASVATMPWLVDHCLIRQPQEGCTLADRFPVVPMTTMVDLALKAAERAGSGRVAVAIEDAVAVRWLLAEPAARVVIRTQETAPGIVDVAIENHFRAKVHLADRYPEPPGSLEGQQSDLLDRRPPPHTAREIYDQRWMFHGPSFQGISETHAFGSNGLDATVVAKPPPGALLDAVGQLFGYWVAYSTTEDRMAFPFRIDRIDFYGPDPTPGDRLTAHVRIAAVEQAIVKGSFEVVAADGRPWATVTHFTDRRFEGDRASLDQINHPEVSTTGVRRGEFWLVHDASSPANRELMMRRHLGAEERAAYDERPPRGRKGWLLGRVAVKDAVRTWLWDRGHPPIYPIEVPVHNDDAGRPWVSHPGPADLRVSLAHAGSVAVAIVAEGRDVGIDLEPVEPRSKRFAELVLTDGEQALGAGLDHDRWVTRLWTAKEAVAKTLGTGLQGRPKDLEAVELDGDLLLVRDRSGGDHWVRSTTETTPEGEFVVSHTAPHR